MPSTEPPNEVRLPVTGGVVPVPDPTTLTNQLVTRAVLAVREVLETQISELHNRINRMEPTLFNRLTASMEQLKELHGEKFKALQTSIDRIMAMESRSSVIGSDHGGGAARPGADDRRL